MQEVEIRVPNYIDVAALRTDLEDIIQQQGGKAIDVRNFPISDKLTAYLQELTVAQGKAPEEVISIPGVTFTNRKAYALYYGVGQLKFYSKSPGLIITMTNDLNCFMELVPIFKGYRIYYSAKVILDGFDEYSSEFLLFKQRIAILK
ncbi:MAG: hypothetical protein AABW48_02415 [Nanoarchaeota archaeon]